ncbi:MAG: ABC transporter ATP-binding protein [Eubacterium sp.]|nr:ABC transporter ATP-binding protein [Eubacterium sp.]
MEILTIDNIKKRFGEKEVLRGVSFSVGEGSIFGFIGRNGAGKTTTMKTILGLLPADSGSVMVCGERVTYGETATNRFVGYLPDVPEFYPYMRAKEYLQLCGEITGLSGKELKSRIDELLSLVGLAKEKGKIGGYSRGMKQRLGIAQALIGRPRLLICDEPTSALDPLGRHEILDILLTAREQTSVLFSTHILSDVERISDHVALLEGGEVKAFGAIEELKSMRSETGARLVLKDAADEKKVRDAFSKLPGMAGEHQTGEPVRQKGSIEFPELSAEEEGKLLAFLASERISVTRFERREEDLEDLFLHAVSE